MRYRNSVFDDYAEIARKQGLISTAEEETNPRYDTQDMSAIELLYHVKPNGEQKHIVEQAHPDMIYIAPVHDRMNGVVENGLEQQNVSLNIARRPPNGNNLAERYVHAQEELLQTVIKTSCWLDREGNQELMKQSDVCLEKMTKEAVLHPAVLPIIGVVALIGILGGLSYKSNNPESQGFQIDLSLAQKRLSDSIDDYSELRGPLEPLISNLSALQSAYNAFDSAGTEVKTNIMEIKGATTDQEKRRLIQAKSAKFLTSKTNAIVKTYDNLEAIGKATKELIPGAIDDLKNAHDRYEKPFTTWPGASEVWESFKKVYHKFSPENTKKAILALGVLQGTLMAMSEELKDKRKQLDSLKAEISAPPTSKDQEMQDLLQPENKKAPSPGGIKLQPTPEWA